MKARRGVRRLEQVLEGWERCLQLGEVLVSRRSACNQERCLGILALSWDGLKNPRLSSFFVGRHVGEVLAAGDVAGEVLACRRGACI